MKLYEALAHEISQSILDGVLRPGDRLPSVRQACTSRNISPSTVFQAYYVLEAQGLIQARERSGYFVSVSARSLPPEPDAASLPDEDAVHLDVSERVFEVLKSTMTRDVVPLGSAFPSPLLFPMAKLARMMARSVQNLDPWATVDDLTPGNARLRRQIALRYLIDGLHVQTDDIVVTNGALEALNLCLMAVTRPGDAVLIESPTFYAALQSIERNGLQAIAVPTHPREGIDLAAAERALERHRPKACWLMTNFQNPLGSLMPDEKKRALVKLLARYQVPLIEDDVYGELYFGDKRPTPAKAFDHEGLVMHCSSFSKCLAPGYRVGWVAAGRFARQVAQHKLTTTLNTSAPTQGALALYLESGGYDHHLRLLRHTLARQQAAFMESVARHFPEGTRATRPKGGYFLWLELPAGVDALHVHRQALAQGISVAPGPLFSAQPDFKHCLRLNYGHIWDARVDAALATLGRLVAAAQY
ncbi:PLP-dependent aminotransferase family protein [Janthinobacterium fluminis]|uniref:PLP-dependent aminotransferase family protein n=1 Tax=Janthinobacterium fluminis TaxID=2987524 RepID=A0ABT5JXD9_9BURK|nr:PLP-dependent aminotransferase family protein [Janthinobacterium fluminis]MDC8757095.1 PLP-dependent aminotransferase family protein [Janthinobacterium fluminis]